MTITADPVILDLEPIQGETSEALQSGALATTPLAGPMGMAVQAMRSGMSLADMREMLVLQKEWEANEARKAFRQDFAAFRGENIIIPKTKHVDRGKGGSFDQAEYDQVCGRLSPALSRHGFGFRHDQRFGSRRWMTDGAESDVGWVWVTCHLEHRLGHTESLELEGPPGELTVNTPTQNMQTTASYLKRQSLLAITGTATGGEDDENRMRKRPGATNEANVDEDEAHLNAGREAAMNGMKDLLAWWGALEPKVRSRLQKDYPGMRKAAEEADHAK